MLVILCESIKSFQETLAFREFGSRKESMKLYPITVPPLLSSEVSSGILLTRETITAWKTVTHSAAPEHIVNSFLIHNPTICHLDVSLRNLNGKKIMFVCFIWGIVHCYFECLSIGTLRIHSYLQEDKPLTTSLTEGNSS